MSIIVLMGLGGIALIPHSQTSSSHVDEKIQAICKNHILYKKADTLLPGYYRALKRQEKTTRGTTDLSLICHKSMLPRSNTIWIVLSFLEI